jgi:TRAP-type C4-dicarboxylate transport system permease small subunit
MSDDGRANPTHSNKPDAPGGALWAAPLARLNDSWQGLEARMCAVILLVEVSSLTLWIMLKGLATDYAPGENAAGLVTRALLSTVICGVGAHLALRGRGGKVHRNVVTAAVAFGFFIAPRLWAHAGVMWASNLLNCLQNASTLMLVGGLRGIATRLTLWLALIGASLATSRGKHIHVDVLIRYVPAKLRAPTAVIGWLTAAIVSTVAVFGFVDYIGIAEFRVPAMTPCADDATKSCDAPTGQKLGQVAHEMGNDLFLLGRQASLDLKSMPRVLVGVPYDKWMKAGEWNAWLDGADWTAHFDKNAIDALHMDPSDPNATHMPQVVVPGTGEAANGLLIRDANMVFPLGLAMIALKFLLRIVLVLTGHIEVHAEEELDDEDLANAADRDKHAAEAT